MSEDNKRLTRTLEYEVTDGPMLAHAMMIAANTALMCGHDLARGRFQKYRKMFLEVVPEAADLFDEETWGEIGILLAVSDTLDVRLLPGTYRWGAENWNDGVRIQVTVGYQGAERKFYNKFLRLNENPLKRGDERCKKVFQTLQELAPLSCTSSLTEAE